MTIEVHTGLNELIARPRTPARVLFIIPTQSTVYGTKVAPAYAPLGVLWLAASLEKAGHQCQVIDMDTDRIDLNHILSIIKKENFSIIGLTAVTATYNSALRCAQTIRFACPEKKIILGGIHATVDPQTCAREQAIDFVVIGEGECTIIELVDAIARNETDYTTIDGLAFRDKQGKVIVTNPRRLIPVLDELPLPARHLIKHWSRYAPADATFSPAFPLMVSRGCSGACTYCQTKNIFGRALRFRSAQSVLDEIRELVSRYGAKEIHFLDDVLTANRTFVFELCRLLKNEPYRLRLEVANGLRADMVDKDILAALQEVGLRNVGFGVESGSERVLTSIKKGITKQKVRQAVSIAKQLGLKTWCFFIIGFPDDDAASIQETIDFALELDPLFAKFLILKPYPGSEVYQQLQTMGLILDFDFSHYGVYTPPVHRLLSLTADQLLHLQKQAFRRFYLRPKKIIEHLLELRSWGKVRSVIRGMLFVIKKMR